MILRFLGGTSTTPVSEALEMPGAAGVIPNTDYLHYEGCAVWNCTYFATV
ncbi:MAG: hypothetical protein GF363_14595 [Chitinivibrionales bacterium]|nr:hypothetical protein [Chitinivibrionales bacterium]